MKRYRDPTPAIEPPREELPLTERIFCGIIIAILVLGAVWISTHLRDEPVATLAQQTP